MAVVTLAQNLRLKVIAEGIETKDQLKFLRLLRRDRGQGYSFGKPAPARSNQTDSPCQVPARGSIRHVILFASDVGEILRVSVVSPKEAPNFSSSIVRNARPFMMTCA